MHRELSNTPRPAFMVCWWELLCSQTSRRGLELLLLKVEVNLSLGKTGLQETLVFPAGEGPVFEPHGASQVVFVEKNLPKSEGDA